MARPQRTNVDYFPHPVHQGKKMAFIKKKYGNDGYAIWYQLIEQLGDANNHYLNLSDETELMLLSTALMTTETRLMEVITDLIRLKVLNKELWEKHSIVFDQKFIDDVQDAYSKRKNKCITLEGLCTLLSIKLRKKPGKCIPITPGNPQSKVKYTKEYYLKSLNDFRKSISPEWIGALKIEYSSFDVIKMLKKIADYWATDEGYQKKLKAKTKNIDWKATFKNGMNMEWNQIIK